MKRIYFYLLSAISISSLFVLSISGTRNPHGKIDIRCEVCHMEASWDKIKQDGFDHDKTGFPLIGAHEQVKCASCHRDLKFDQTPEQCADCHNDIHRGTLGTQCQNCHTAESWENQRDLFDQHAALGFPLTGVHATADCNSCHRGESRDNFAGTPTECAGCHVSDFKSTTNPDHEIAGFSMECEQCHALSANTWNRANYIHTPAFALQGGHSNLECISCHATRYSGTSIECYNCHNADFVSAPDPDHEQANFDHDCSGCHNVMAWSPATFDHNLTGFPLTERHANVECAKCHTNGYTNTSNDCYTCHQTDFSRAENPDHDANNFDHNCTSCHNTRAWEPSTFDHNNTQFALTGAHRSVDCANCHATGYSSIATDCYSCHSDNFVAVADPNHVSSGFNHDCTTCHTTNGWTPVDFDHSTTGFALTGGHSTLECQSCHANGYTSTSPDCYSCHESKYAETTDPNHLVNSFPHQCAQCHTTTAWIPAEPRGFDHTVTGFILDGAHAPLACMTCHSQGFTDTSPLCYSCHSDNFASAGDPNHAQNNFDHDCRQCHTTGAWSPATFDHAATSFPLTGAHAVASCISCHAGGYTLTPTDCYSCHAGNFTAAIDPNHVQMNLNHDCSQCHSTTGWQPASYDHNTTDFPLTGAHTDVSCISCHATGYTATSIECYSCHQGDFTGVTNPNHVQQNFDHNCSQCHSTMAWKPSTFDHSTTAFPLTGAHASADCISCHASGYTLTPTDCFSCHSGDFTGTTDPNHVQQNFDHNCSQCHNTVAWMPSTFDHGTTQFPLTGAHISLSCITCHSSGYTNLATTCVSCHQQRYDSEENPKHALAGFSTECQTCHSTSAWNPSSWNHSTTGFSLTGAHVALDCQACHSVTYAGTANTCYGCHESDFTSVTDPNHVTNNFNHDCTQCHGTTAWKPTTFDHAITGFPLIGGHAGVPCATCHASGYTGTSGDCYSCHSGDFTSVTNPNHVANNFDHNCTTCHNVTAWIPATFNHSTTNFPLTGAHVPLQCIACHSQGYTGTTTACYDCHTGDFTSVTDPNHVANNFSHLCTTCHNTTAWVPSTFDHNTTQFPLTGAHLPIQCVACHSQGYAGTTTACYDCHTGDFTSVTDPNHVTNNFSHLCISCHNTTAWSPATFDHSTTQFPLTGAHSGLMCFACHSQGYTGTTTACYDCHTGDFTSVTDPNHVTNNFSHICNDCHNTTAWSPATFDHSTTDFPLTGAHLPLQCIACHSSGYTATPILCYACHQSAFDGTTNPNHFAAHFPTTCQTCHSTTAWTPANWNHDALYFRIYSGKHKDKWSACADCHVNTSDYAVFECILCHEHNKTSTDDHHKDVNGYNYNSNACFNCHPRV